MIEELNLCIKLLPGLKATVETTFVDDETGPATDLNIRNEEIDAISGVLEQFIKQLNKIKMDNELGSIDDNLSATGEKD